MTNPTFKIARTIALALGLSAFIPSFSQAQSPPMDMSWGIRAQMQYQAQGDAAARAAAMQYYRYMQQLRAAGYTGPSLPTGVTNESLRAEHQRRQSGGPGVQPGAVRELAAPQQHGVRLRHARRFAGARAPLSINTGACFTRAASRLLRDAVE